MTVIDLATRHDLVDEVAAWIHAQWGQTAGRTYEQTRARFCGPTEGEVLPLTMVALDDAGKAQGVASLRNVDSTDWMPGVRPWICNVFVTQEARGLRVASVLCAALESHARALDFTSVYLATGREDSLYHKRGYREVARVTINGASQIVMVKALDGAVSSERRVP